MSKKTLKIVLGIAFTVLFFLVWFGVDYLLTHRIDWPEAIFWFVIIGFMDAKGIPYLVDYYGEKLDKGRGKSAERGSGASE